MNRYSVTIWVCVLIAMVVPWLAATILSWAYAAGYEGDDSIGEVEIGEVAAILQTSSAALYILYILFAILCMGVAGQSDSYGTYCCLAIGIPVFAAVPVVCAIILFVSAFGNPDSVGMKLGISAAVLCLVSTFVCLCVTTCALFCGTVGKGKTSRYPTPISYVPFLEKTQRREDKEEEVDMYTLDYPTPLHKLPPRKSITISENGDVFPPEDRKESNSSTSYKLGQRDKPRRYSFPVGTEAHRKVSTASTLSTASERERRINVRRSSQLSSQSEVPQEKSPSSKIRVGAFWMRRFSKTSENTDSNEKPAESREVARSNKRSVPRRYSTGDVQKIKSEPAPSSRTPRKYSAPSFAVK